MVWEVIFSGKNNYEDFCGAKVQGKQNLTFRNIESGCLMFHYCETSILAFLFAAVKSFLIIFSGKHYSANYFEITFAETKFWTLSYER